MAAENLASPFPERVTTTVRRYMADFNHDIVAKIRVGLGIDTLTMIYYATCEALSLDARELMERAAILDAHPTEGDTAAHAERRYFGSIIESYQRNCSTYQFAAHYTEEQADARAIDGLRQAYAERIYRLALADEHTEEYPGILNTPAFTASVSLVARLAYQGCMDLYRPTEAAAA